MGDRTYAHITYPYWADVLIADYYGEQNLDRFWGDDRIISEHVDTEEDEIKPTVTWVGASECDYGEHPLQEVLYELGIPFDNEWDSGGNYQGGCGSARLDGDGELRHEEAEYVTSAATLDALVLTYKTQGEQAALEQLRKLSSKILHSAQPITHVPPTLDQVDRIISLLCDGPSQQSKSMKKAA